MARQHHHRGLIVTLISIIAILGVTGIFMLHRSEPKSAPSHPSTLADRIVALPLRTQLAQKLMVAVYASSIAADAPVVNDLHIGGVIVMDDISATALQKFRAQQAIAPLIAVDQEGGTVQRYPENQPLPGATDIVAADSPAQAYQLYRQDFRQLAALGITTNFAPVVGTAYPGLDPLPGRIYSSDPATVVQYARAAITAAQSVGITPVIKHFPGLGSTSTDTDFGSATTVPYSELQQKDLIPYRELQPLHPDVMVSNAIVPGLTGGQPASLSPAAYHALRTAYGYSNAVVYTDSLDADAITDSIPVAVSKAWVAGADIALIVQPANLTPDQLRDEIDQIIDQGVTAVSTGTLPHSTLTASLQRIFARKPTTALPSAPTN